MANSVRLIDYTQPQGDFITFFTELDSDLKVGDKVFIIGGNYDNTKYTDSTHPEFDPFNEYASGYEVIAVDSTTNSNAVTLNIKFRIADFNQAGVETSIFNPLPVYKTEEELLIQPNQTRESYISKSYFKRGEFNGGTFDDGIFGEYNIKGTASTSGDDIHPLRNYERQHFVDNLIAEYRANGMDAEADALENYNYGELEIPVLNNTALFNNNFENIQATWKNGVFLGGDYQWGNWESKYSSDKTGLIQTLNELGGAVDLLDTSKFNISEFNNNNNGFGYSLMTSGNVGRIYRSEEKHDITIIADTRTIQIDYFPYPLWKSLDKDRFDVSIRVFSKDNDKVFDIESISSTSGTNDIIISEMQRYETLGSTESTSFHVEQLLFDEVGSFDIEIYVKDNENKNRNTINTTRIYNSDIFGGVIDNAYIQGGDVHWGEFRRGRVASNYGRMHWNNGVFNGLKEESFAEDLRWNNGKFIDGNWKGDINVSIKNFEISDSLLLINIPKRYKHLLQKDDDVFISYFKKSIGNSYFDNFTDSPDVNPINFREFKLRNIIENDDLDNELQVQLVLEGNVDEINEDVNLQYAKISQSYFTKGYWNDGIWESGLRKVQNNKVNNFNFFKSQGTNFLEFQLDIDRANLINKGELMDVSNLQAVREINIGIIDGVPTIDNVTEDDRTTQFLEPFNSILTVLDVSTSGLVLTTFKELDEIDSDSDIDWNLGGDLVDIIEILGSSNGVSLYNKSTELTNTIWVYGQFKSGAWQGGIWKNGILSSDLYFDNDNKDIQSIFQSGYWKDGVWNKGTLLSGVWESGIYNDGVVTNLFNNTEDNDKIILDKGDTVFIDGVINNVEWRRGLMLSSQFNGGKIINGGIENVDFKGGQYTNGLGVFNNSINSNRSGRLLDNGSYVDLSAPNLIYIDGNGWVQLDQNSFYQKDYNVVIQDLDKYDNPFNNEMFNVRDRNKYGSRLQIDYSTSGDNPLYLLDEFASFKPILAIDNINGIAQITESKYWIGDSNHKRILEIDTVTNEVDVLGLILGDSSKDIYNFNQIKFLKSSSLLETSGINEQQVLYVYIVDSDENGNDIVKSISVDKQRITTININLDTINGEEITDISVAPINNSLQAETVIVSTNLNNIFYALSDWTEFKSFSLPNEVQNVTSISALRKTTSNTIDLLLYSNTISHLILDFNFTSQEYQVRATSPIVIENMDISIDNKTVSTFDAKYVNNAISIWFALGNTELYRFNYEDIFNGNINSLISLNEKELEFPVSGISLNYDSSNLNVIGLNGNDSLFLASAKLDKNVAGFGNTNSPIKFLVRNILSLNDNQYWYYDDETSRIIHVNESLENKYDVSTDVDTVETNSESVEIVKMTGGDSDNRIFSIQKEIDINGNTYKIRKSEYGKSDSNNDTIFEINGVGVIYDIVYLEKLFILSSNPSNNDRPVITAIDNQVTTSYTLSNMNYYDTTNIYGTNGNMLSFDVVKEGNNFLCLVSDENSLYELVLDDNSIISNRIIYDQTLPTVYDIAVRLEGEFTEPTVLTKEKHYSAYLSTDNGIVKIFSDRKLAGTLNFRWSEFGSDLYYEGVGVTELNKDKSSNSIIAKVGESYITVDGKYISEDYILDSHILSPVGDIFGLSNSRVVEMDSTSGETLISNRGVLLGLYDQNNRVGEYATTADEYDLLLNNPKSIIHASAFLIGLDYVFFIDSTSVSTDKVIRYYNSNGDYGIISGVGEYKDLSYDDVNNRIYYLEIVGTASHIGYIDTSLTKVTPATDLLANTATVSGNIYEKFSYSDLGGTKVFACLKSDAQIDIVGVGADNDETIEGASSKNYSDISLLEQLGQYIIFIQFGDVLETITNNSTPVTTGGNWGSPESVNVIDIENIAEVKSGGNEELSVYSTVRNDIVTINVDPTNINEDSVKLKDFGFNNFGSTDYMFLYNDPLVDSKGIVKTLKTSSNSIGVNRSNQLDDANQSETFVTMTVLDDDRVFALFNDGTKNKLYYYNFLDETVTEVTDNPLAFRSNTEQSPDLSLFDYEIKDISTYDGKILVLFEIINELSVSEGYYDVALYNYSNSTYSKLDFVYSNSTDEPSDLTNNLDAITSSGNYNVVRYRDTGGNGGIRYLFQSDVEARLDVGSNDDYIFFYFGNVGSADFVKIVKSVTPTTIVNNEVEDLVVDISIPGFNNNPSIEVVDSVTIFPDPNTGTGSLPASSIGAGASSDKVRATFTNSGSFDTNLTYKFRVKTTLQSGQITRNDAPFPDGNEIYDFRVYGSGEDKIIIRKLVGNKPINSIDNDATYYELVNTSIGKWEIQDEFGTLKIELKAPIQPTPTGTSGVYTNVLSNNQEDFILQALTPLDDNYQLDVINKGYKVDYDSSVLSPYLTGRVLLDTLIQEDVIFNNLGTTKTAHLVSSTWDSGLFLGTWDAPFYFDNKIIEDFSIFVNGTFEGDFYDGFFLGGTFQNNSSVESNIFQGHFTSDDSNIDFLSGNLSSDYRYDILNAKFEDDKVKFTIEGLKLTGDDYYNTIVTNVNRGSVVKIPELFKANDYEIKEIIRGDIKVNGKDEITFVIDKPSLPLISTDSEIVDFFNQILFVQSFENANYLFGYYEPVHIFIKDEDMYITVQSEFNNFDNDGTYVPSVKPIIRFNAYNRISKSETILDEDDNKYYTNIEVDLITPSTLTDVNALKFVQKYYIKENIQVMLEGRFKSSIIIPDYLQLFSTTFNKSENQVSARFNSSIQNMYISNVIGDNLTDFSNITVDLGSEPEGLFAHDLMVFNSYITTPNNRPKDWLRNNIFVSGKTDRTWKSGVWLNLDETGFSNGESQFGDENIINLFDGENSKIIDIFFEGEKYLWIELETIIDNVDIYRYITLRGFTGNKAQLIGTTRSNAFRILEVDNNLIKIKNPFLEYQGILGKDFFNNFNNDELLIQKQEMILKGLYGINLKACDSDAKNFNNNDFTLSLSNDATESTWYQTPPTPTGKRNWYINNNKLVGTFGGTTVGGDIKVIAQDYKFKKGVEYTVSFKFTFYKTPTGYGNITFYLNPNDLDSYTLETFDETDIISNTELSFTFIPDKDYETFGFDANLSYMSISIDEINVETEVVDTTYEFDYGYASVSCFNGGNFYGDFNTVWNAGDFRNGTFLSDGKWFGSDENYSYNGLVPVVSEKTDTKYQITVGLDIDFVQDGDFIRLDYASIFTQQELKELFSGVYGIVESATSGAFLVTGTSSGLVYESDDFISDGLYNVNIVKHRVDYEDNNYLLVDYNSNLYNNSSVNDQLNIFDNNIGTNGVSNSVLSLQGSSGIPTIDLINIALEDGNNDSQFSFDMYFNYNASTDKQPLLAFHNSSNKLRGISFYIEDDKLFVEYVDEQNAIVPKELHSGLTPTNWNHIAFSYDISNGTNGDIKSSLNGGSIYNDVIYIADKHDVNYIGRMVQVDVTNDIIVSNFDGKIDEVRFWNVDMFNYQGNDFFNSVVPEPTGLRSIKLMNTHLPEITAYYDFDDSVDAKSYFPEEEDFFVLNGNNTYTLKENDEPFVYSGESLFIEVDYFSDKSDLSSGEYKLFTIEEIRDVSDNTSIEELKYYLEVILKEDVIDKFKYNIVLRERLIQNNPSNFLSDDLYSTNETIFSDFDIRFFEKTNLLITDKKVYINGELIGEYNLLNRNLFKYTVNTKVHLGKYEFATEFGVAITPETFGFVGFINNINMWTNANSVDEYLIYRIISGESTEIYNQGESITVDNIELYKGNSSNNIIPYFNNDGSQIWEHYIYSSENDYEQSLQEANIDITELDSQYRYTDSRLNTALPENTWLEGTDFIQIDTDDSIIDDKIPLIKNENYILTRANGADNRIRISGMENFKFFNKNVAIEGTAFLNVGASGYLFFEDFITGSTPRFPLFSYNDTESNEFYNQTSTTDAIQFNTILDIRKSILHTINAGGTDNPDKIQLKNVEYADREDEFVIKFFGLSTNMLKDGSVYYYENHTSTIDPITGTESEKIVRTARFSMFAIRIDKVNSNILIYTRRLDESNDQKYAGLRRSDGFWSHINDNNDSRLSYYKSPSNEDYVIGFESTTGNSESFNNTEYSIFVPRFDINDLDDGYVDYIINKDYDSLFENYGIKLFKQFNGKADIDFTIVEESLGLKQYYVNSLSDIIDFVSFDPLNFKNPIYDKNGQYLKTQTENNVSRVSFFHNGTFNGSVWHNGIFVNGNAKADNLIWKYGIKHNGTFEGGEDLINHAHWLGGFHTTDTNDLSFMKNLAWYRGRFNGGTWEKGQWLALDLDNIYEKNGVRNDDWSLFTSGEWYSRIDEEIVTVITNLFEDAENGTFESDSSGWGLTEGSNFNLIGTALVDSPSFPPKIENSDSEFACEILTETAITTIIGTFSNPINIFSGNNILVERNTEYEITAKVYVDGTNPSKNIGMKFDVISDSPIANVYNIGYRYESANSFMDIQEGNNPLYSLDEDDSLWVEIKHKFNTLENDVIKIGLFGYNIGSGFDNYDAYIDNIEMIGEKLNRTSADPYKIENHDSVWHGGLWSSPNVIKEFDGNNQPVFYEYSYQNDTFNLYRVKNNQVLDLPKVNSIWLGGLWLRGEFDGGIFANGFWNSVKCDSATSGLVYEERIGSTYDETYSLFKQGQMINSIWEGGIVDDEGDKLDTVFGDLTQSSETLISKDNSFDFTWENDFEFKVSTANVYSPELFGRTEFIGYHNDPLFNGEDDINLEIEIKRVRRQFNTDGVMSVYWKRGKFNNGMFQFSHFDSLDLDQNRQTIISEELADNYSIFNGLIYSSKWKNGLFLADATDDEYPLLNEEPNSLFYYSNWDKGYWKSEGLKTTSGSPLDTVDNIDISNALFSRSVWTAGVFEGGMMDLSIWRSGVSEPTELKYKGMSINLVEGNPDNLAYYISSEAVNGTDFGYGTSGEILPRIANDMMFTAELENTKVRFAGSVDNLASIWVNGCMRGSIWHGGTWQRGMFRERAFEDETGNVIVDSLDFFGNAVDIETPYQLGVWFRGIWMSGYFSYYNDKVIKQGADLNVNAHLYNNAFKLGDIKNNNEGRRCLFFSINAQNLTDPSNFIGMNDDSFTNYLSSASDINNINNYASIYSRTLIKETITNPTTKSYWNIFNGSFINGTIYAPSNTGEFISDENKMVFSLFSTLSDTYLDTISGNFLSVDGNSDKIFNKSIRTSPSIIPTDIPYTVTVTGNPLPTVMYNTSTKVWENALDFNFVNNNIISKSGFPTFSDLNIWRHNTDEGTNSSAILFGDGTITTDLPEFLDGDDNLNQVSIAQGCGMKWHSDESEGEPKFDENIGTEEINYFLDILDFDSGGFDGTNFIT
jgi:hypothetical protein